MKNNLTKIAIMLILLCMTVFAQQKGSFKDTRDGKTYKTVKIGNQVWMAENLNYRAENSKCYGEDGKYEILSNAEIQANCNKYGRLYDLETALNVCPKNWHLPSDEEWNILVNFVDEKIAGKKLKTRNGWNDNGNGTDIYGFSALPGGARSPYNEFDDIGNSGYWWSSTDHDGQYAYYRRKMSYDNDDVISFSSVQHGLYSVRCIQN